MQPDVATIISAESFAAAIESRRRRMQRMQLEVKACDSAGSNLFSVIQRRSVTNLADDRRSSSGGLEIRC
jgi:hypothetical protein